MIVIVIVIVSTVLLHCTVILGESAWARGGRVGAAARLVDRVELRGQGGQEAAGTSRGCVAAWLRGGVLSGLLCARRPPTNQGRAGQGSAPRSAVQRSAAQGGGLRDQHRALITCRAVLVPRCSSSFVRDVQEAGTIRSEPQEKAEAIGLPQPRAPGPPPTHRKQCIQLSCHPKLLQ